MEAELSNTTAMATETVEKSPQSPKSPAFPSLEEKQKSDAKSIYVGNVDYSTTESELQKHFEAIGVIVRATIMRNRYTQRPKGFAYVEFENEASAPEAKRRMNGSFLNGRAIKIELKRTNVPNWVDSESPNTSPAQGRSRLAGRLSFSPQHQNRVWTRK